MFSKLFNVLILWPTPSTLPSKSNPPIEYSITWTRFLGSWKSRFFNFLNCQNRRERENILTYLITRSPVWAKSRIQFKDDLQPFVFTGFDSWKPKVTRLPLWRNGLKDSGFSLQVLWCLHKEDFIWIGVDQKASQHPEKDIIKADLFIL